MRKATVVAMIAVAALTLGACGKRNPILTQDRLVVIKPPAEMYQCPEVLYPNPDTLTDKEVANLLVDLDEAKGVCQNSLNAIREYLDKAQQEAERPR